jgi:hypothetical protein
MSVESEDSNEELKKTCGRKKCCKGKCKNGGFVPNLSKGKQEVGNKKETEASEMKLIIAGSRDFEDYEYLKENISSINGVITEVVSGTARGADRLGERYADEHGIKCKKIPANWDKYGKSAGYKRNEQMAKYADNLIAFWDGKSKGTGHMIDIAKRLGLNVHVVRI